MQPHYTKMAFTGVWISVVVLAALLGNVSSAASWAMMALLAVIPPTLFWQLFHAPIPSMSENIRKALKD